MRARCEDYFRMGVPEAWIFDPARRACTVLRPDGSLITQCEGSLRLEGTAIEVPLTAIFGILDL